MQHLGSVRLGALLVAFIFAIASGPAAASHVQCGDVITQDTTLDSDVTCTGDTQDPMIAVTIAADRLTLDLNGFSIIGPNRGEGVEDLQAGIATNGAYRSVTIKNGTIEGFSEGM